MGRKSFFFESSKRIEIEPCRKTSNCERRRIAIQNVSPTSAKQPVWWCEQLGTVLANEEVVDGKSEVGGFPVVRKPMRQWMLRITAYAEKLLQDLDTIDWSDSLKEMQRNWIGRSEGAEVDFEVGGSSRCDDQTAQRAVPTITVFTTRPDTLFGATYMVLAPEHKLIDRDEKGRNHHCRNKEWTGSAKNPNDAIVAYQWMAKSDLERTELAKEKTGVFTGAYAINPVNGQKIPIWIADYVLASYGTGAIMAVPAHDTRDFEFATKFNLPIVQVVQPPDPKVDWQGFVGDGTSVNSTGPEISSPACPRPKPKRKSPLARRKKSRQENHQLQVARLAVQPSALLGRAVPDCLEKGRTGSLITKPCRKVRCPLLPPTLEDYKPTATGEPPLARAKDWVNLPDGSVRETNTMPQWAGSCWYYLRYLDAKNPVPPSSARNSPKLLDGSKSRGNVVNPDDVLKDFGADALRLYEMFMGPLEMVKPWSTKGVEGVYRFLGRVWRLFVDEQSETEFEQAETTEPQKGAELLKKIRLSAAIKNAQPLPAQLKTLHTCIKKVTEDLDGMRFNTAISAMMVFINDAMTWETKPVIALRNFLVLLQPFAPHLAEELWDKLHRPEWSENAAAVPRGDDADFDFLKPAAFRASDANRFRQNPASGRRKVRAPCRSCA
jgi:leucyl-tRNA synthetase